MEGSSTLRGSHILKSMSFRSNNVSLHIDARIAIVLVFVYSVALFLADSWMALGLFAVGLFAVLVAARVSFVKVMRGMVPLLFILAFTVVAHIPQGIIEGSFYAFRIFLLAVATLSVAFSYDDTRLVRAFTFFLSPFRKACVPVDDIATMFSIALRFIPVSMDEFQRVSSAQRARGANLDEGDVIERVKNWGAFWCRCLWVCFAEPACWLRRWRRVVTGDALVERVCMAMRSSVPPPLRLCSFCVLQCLAVALLL